MTEKSGPITAHHRFLPTVSFAVLTDRQSSLACLRKQTKNKTKKGDTNKKALYKSCIVELLSIEPAPSVLSLCVLTVKVSAESPVAGVAAVQFRPVFE